MTNKIDFQIDFFCPSSISYKFEEKLTLFLSNELYALVIPKIRLNEKNLDVALSCFRNLEFREKIPKSFGYVSSWLNSSVGNEPLST